MFMLINRNSLTHRLTSSTYINIWIYARKHATPPDNMVKVFSTLCVVAYICWSNGTLSTSNNMKDIWRIQRYRILCITFYVWFRMYEKLNASISLSHIQIFQTYSSAHFLNMHQQNPFPRYNSKCNWFEFNYISVGLVVLIILFILFAFSFCRCMLDVSCVCVAVCMKCHRFQSFCCAGIRYSMYALHIA